jgi:hypothetical protein
MHKYAQNYVRQNYFQQNVSKTRVYHTGYTNWSLSVLHSNVVARHFKDCIMWLLHLNFSKCNWNIVWDQIQNGYLIESWKGFKPNPEKVLQPQPASQLSLYLYQFFIFFVQTSFHPVFFAQSSCLTCLWTKNQQFFLPPTPTPPTPPPTPPTYEMGVHKTGYIH